MVCQSDTVWKTSNGATLHQNVKVRKPYYRILTRQQVNVNVSEIRCPEPILAEHSILSVTGNDRMYGRTLIRTAESTNVGATSYKIGALVKYRCERGYKVVGEPLSTCEDTGEWSGDVPQCVCK